jgi:hypothetical protein
MSSKLRTERIVTEKASSQAGSFNSENPNFKNSKLRTIQNSVARFCVPIHDQKAKIKVVEAAGIEPASKDGDQ